MFSTFEENEKTGEQTNKEEIDLDLNWEDVTWADKAKLFRYWSVATFIGNLIQIFASTFFMLKGYFGLEISEYLCGFGCMSAYFCLVQYLDYSSRYSFILKTMTYALPIMLRTLVGILPIFIGFVLLATSLFSTAYRFRSPSFTAVTLYSMMNGDELQDVFRDLTSIAKLPALIFLYVWVFIGVAVITNTFVVIVEQGFSSTRHQSRFEWLRKNNPGQQKSMQTLQSIVESEAKKWKQRRDSRVGITAKKETGKEDDRDDKGKGGDGGKERK